MSSTLLFWLFFLGVCFTEIVCWLVLCILLGLVLSSGLLCCVSKIRYLSKQSSSFGEVGDCRLSFRFWTMYS